MTHLHFLLIFSLILITIPSSQSVSYSPKSFYKRFSTQPSSPNPNKNNSSSLIGTTIDKHYLEACTTILKGLDDVTDDDNYYSHFFAEWENPNSDLLDYFEKNKGMVSKIFKDSSYFWALDLIIYDGISIDKKAASVRISIYNPESSMTFDQTNATFTTINNSTFTVYYGEGSDVLSQIDIVGKVSIYFVDIATNQPFSSFDPRTTSVKGKGFQLSFISSDGSFSFNTSVFSDTYMTMPDTIVAYVLAFVLLVIVAFSWYREDLKGRVTYGTFQAFYAAASYILWWVFFQPSYYGLLYGILAIPAFVNFLKFYPHLFNLGGNPSNGTIIGSAFTIFAGFLNWIPTICMNLFPSLVLWFPFLQKIRKMKYDPYYLTRFEVTNYLYILLWMGYGYLYPRNFYRFGQHMTMIYISFGSIIFQFVVLFILEKIAQKRLKQGSAALLQEDESMNNNQASNDERAKPSESESHSHDEDLETPETYSHKYTLYAKIEEYQTLSKKKCGVCRKDMIGKSPQSLYKTPCQHIFHEKCLRDFGAKNMICPSCRKHLPKFSTTKE